MDWMKKALKLEAENEKLKETIIHMHNSIGIAHDAVHLLLDRVKIKHEKKSPKTLRRENA